MKIEIKKPGDSKYYEEYLYLATNYNRVKNSDNKKTGGLMLSSIVYSVIGLLAFALFLILYLKDNRVIFLVAAVVFALVLILGLFTIFVVNNRINLLKKSFNKTTFEIDKDKVSIGKDATLKWKDIECIAFNKNTIVFFPKEGTNFLCTRIEYKDEIVKELKKLKMDDLIIDNIGE